jgi:ABC-2 type transport system ATP-binding protein
MIRLNGVRKTFGSLVAVDGLSLDIRAGEIFGLLGPNGAGKTTTINMIIGQFLPDAGTVQIDGGGSPTESAVRRKIGVAPQALAVYEDLTAEQNVRFFGQLYGLRGRVLQERVAAVLDLVGLHERRRGRVRTFSGGMQRRLNLAIALVHDPRVLLLDEPTAGVDPHSRHAIFEFVERLNAEGRTVLYTTHYMEEAQRLCHRVAIMDNGRILALDTVDGLIAAHGRASTVIVERRTGEERIETADPKAELVRVLAQREVLGVRVERPSLESVFLSLTGRRLRD